MNHSDFSSNLLTLGGIYAAIAKTYYVFQNESDAREKLSSGMYGVYSKVISEGYLYECERAKDFASSLRIMGSPLLDPFLSYAFEKDSPYTELFSHYINRS